MSGEGLKRPDERQMAWMAHTVDNAAAMALHWAMPMPRYYLPPGHIAISAIPPSPPEISLVLVFLVLTGSQAHKHVPVLGVPGA